jgi:hypothetical protein
MKKLVLITFTTLLAGGVAGCKKKDPAAQGSGGGGGATAAKAGDKQPASYGIPDCDAYVASMEKFLTCEDTKLPPPQKEAYRKSLDDRRAQLLEASKGDAARKTAEGEVCKQGLSELVEGAKYRGCPS